MNNNKICPLSLEAFASRFGFSREELSYGIATLENGEKRPVVLVRDKHVFIDIPKDVLSPCLIPNMSQTFESCGFAEDEEGYVFKSGESELVWKREEAEKFYAFKYYNSATEKHV